MFGLSARGTSVRTEMLAGATTFLTMAYIVVVNPLILGQAGMPIEAVTAATCLAAAFGCILMGFMANVPLAMAPGMGLNAYFTFVVVKGMGVPWQTALGCVFISGVVFLILTLAGVRQLIVNAIPRSLLRRRRRRHRPVHRLHRAEGRRHRGRRPRHHRGPRRPDQAQRPWSPCSAWWSSPP